ncbi:glycosyltransferase (plasmid) [Streptomyces sp. BI20]|uniref:glycosyltransferase n=1 Tax=Streptomyces sp. BI20 TaxID=3403460 RepID=UPI003C75BEAB
MRVLLCPESSPGFLYPVVATGRALLARGHAVTLLSADPTGPAARACGLPVLDAGAVAGPDAPRAFRVDRWFLEGPAQYRAVLRAAREARPDVLVTSLLCPGALLAAERLDLPVVVVGLAVHLWPYAGGGAAEPEIGDTREWRLNDVLTQYRKLREECGFRSRPRGGYGQHLLSGAACLLRGPAALEHPGARLPAHVHRVGGLVWEPAPEPGVWEELRARLAAGGKPLVYVHLGRVFGGEGLWPRLEAAFADGPFQAVVETGRTDGRAARPGPWLHPVRLPWLEPLVRGATAVLGNGTSAPVLAALRHRRRLVLAPNGGEQRLLAAACVRAGVAVPMPRSPVALHRLLAAPATPPAATPPEGGPGRAAELVEEAARLG